MQSSSCVCRVVTRSAVSAARPHPNPMPPCVALVSRCCRCAAEAPEGNRLKPSHRKAPTENAATQSTNPAGKPFAAQWISAFCRRFVGATCRREHLGRKTRSRERLRCKGLQKSGRQDSNLRPSAPKAPALPSCATPRMQRS
jgi:hypothetical protein